ncbi:MAG: glycosyltransferase family 2 protein [Paracoccaceae bacterium]
MSVSLCTLVRGRRGHLDALLRGVAASTARPREVVIAWVQEAAFDALPDPGCPVVHVFAPGEPIRLAAARNRATAAARGETLVFLDVDCRPAPDLVAGFEAAVALTDAAVMGAVRYLAEDDPEGDFETAWAAGAIHPARPEPETDAPLAVPDATLWSLAFALPARAFALAGGFDERFEGYGGEDTDFSRALDRAGVGLHATRAARAVHQWHPVHKPPLQHFDAIVTNARLFRAKWGAWCMEYWLDQFAAAELIDWREDADRLVVRRRPSEAEIAASLRPGTVRFS